MHIHVYICKAQIPHSIHSILCKICVYIYHLPTNTHLYLLPFFQPKAHLVNGVIDGYSNHATSETNQAKE